VKYNISWEAKLEASVGIAMHHEAAAGISRVHSPTCTSMTYATVGNDELS
jgi:hypothetical protein